MTREIYLEHSASNTSIGDTLGHREPAEVKSCGAGCEEAAAGPIEMSRGGRSVLVIYGPMAAMVCAALLCYGVRVCFDVQCWGVLCYTMVCCTVV
jgi:hypothetical protein